MTGEFIFPELKESEDERIKSVFRELAENYLFWEKSGLTKEKALAWLEKQGQTFTKKDVDDAYLKGISDTKNELEKQGEQKPAEVRTIGYWNVQDIEKNPANKVEPNDYSSIDPYFFKPVDKVEPKFKIGDKIKLVREPKYPAREIVAIQDDAYYFDEVVHLPFSRQDEWELVGQKPDWSEEDEKFVHGLIRGLAAKRDIHGHTTFSSDYIDITETINWLNSLKNRVQPQPKPAWSEEDEERLSDAIFFVREYQIPTRDKRLLNAAKEAEDWLKSLRPQNTWKPSEEQMDMLAKVCSTLHLTSGENKTMESIYDALERLREE